MPPFVISVPLIPELTSLSQTFLFHKKLSVKQKKCQPRRLTIAG